MRGELQVTTQCKTQGQDELVEMCLVHARYMHSSVHAVLGAGELSVIVRAEDRADTATSTDRFSMEFEFKRSLDEIKSQNSQLHAH